MVLQIKDQSDQLYRSISVVIWDQLVWWLMINFTRLIEDQLPPLPHLKSVITNLKFVHCKLQPED